IYITTSKGEFPKPLNNQNAPEIPEFFKINEWQARLDAKDVPIDNLRKHIKSLKGKSMVEKDVQPHNPNVITPGMFKLDLKPLALRVLNNMDAHIDYIKHSQEHADTLQEIDVLVYVKATCPSLTKHSEQLVAVTPLNKNKKVRCSIFFSCRFQIVKIMGYGDYQIGKVTISQVYYVEGLGHNLFSVGQFSDSDLKLQRQSLGYGIEGKSKRHSHKPKAEDSIQEKLYLLHMDLCGPMRINGVVKRQNRTLVEAARTMLIFSKASLFLWAEAIATVCFTQNQSLIRKHHNKTPYELLHNKKPDLSYLYVVGALCYPTNDSEDIGKLKPKADIGIFIDYAPTKKAF
ncbi:retrovirus-related pol polyprotein from transposon TNT 1-94, partial [Tanacetum coccineum]